MIEIKNLTKDFGGSIAVNDVSFRVPEKSDCETIKLVSEVVRVTGAP